MYLLRLSLSLKKKKKSLKKKEKKKSHGLFMIVDEVVLYDANLGMTNWFIDKCLMEVIWLESMGSILMVWFSEGSTGPQNHKPHP